MHDQLSYRTLDSMLCEPRGAIALQDLDACSLDVSSSGGAFAVFARTILRAGGAVFGAALLEGRTVRHVCVRDVNELVMLQGSKYVRSDVSDTYKECAQLLNDGVEVLYSGTPCQIASLRRFLDKKVPSDVISRNLLCIDLICHGTPSQDIFTAYLKWLADVRKTDDGIHDYVFRSKKTGWGLYYHYWYSRGGKKRDVLGPARDDPYYSAFEKGIIYRKCCYSCPFARLERVGDITIGDYWGIDLVHPGFSDGRGVSAVLLNTVRGERFFVERCVGESRWVETCVKDVASHNANLVAPTTRSDEHKKLAEEVERALAAGDYRRVFGELLAPKLSVSARVRRALPWRLVHTLSRLKP